MSRPKKRKSNSHIQDESPFDELADLMGLDKSEPVEEPEPEVAEIVAEVNEPHPNQPTVVKTSKRGQKNMNRGRVDIVRQTAHRGGKAVTVAQNFKGIPLAEKKELAKKMQKACGVGGTVKDGCIEIQGDNRDVMKRILEEAGFNPVFAGG